MVKKKTKKAAAKRFRVTRNGKVLYTKAGRRHLAGSKSTKRKRQLRTGAPLAKPDAKRIAAMI